MDFTNGMKKAFLASVGAAATTAEVTKDILEKMIEKGERTLLKERIAKAEALQKEKQEAEEDVEVEESEATTDSETSQVQEDETEQ